MHISKMMTRFYLISEWGCNLSKDINYQMLYKNSHQLGKVLSISQKRPFLIHFVQFLTFKHTYNWIIQSKKNCWPLCPETNLVDYVFWMATAPFCLILWIFSFYIGRYMAWYHIQICMRDEMIDFLRWFSKRRLVL